MATTSGFLRMTATRIALLGGVSTFALYQTVPFMLGSKIKATTEYKTAMQLLLNHPEGMKYLGEPLKEYRVNTMWKDDYGSDEEKAWFVVPVKGPKAKGRLYCEFPKENFKNRQNVKITKVELTIDKLPDYKLVIKKPE